MKEEKGRARPLVWLSAKAMQMEGSQTTASFLLGNPGYLLWKYGITVQKSGFAFDNTVILIIKMTVEMTSKKL